MTELEAVNRLLLSAGLPLVSSLEQAPEDAIRARDHIRNHTEETVTQDWAFNTREDVALSKDPDGKIYVPENTSYVTFYQDTQMEFSPVQVGNEIISRSNQTLPDPLRVKRLIIQTAWEDIPKAIQFFILKLAENDFIATALGDPDLTRHSQATLAKSWNDLQQYRTRTGPTPLFRVSEVLHRGFTQASPRQSRMR